MAIVIHSVVISKSNKEHQYILVLKGSFGALKPSP